MRFLRLRVVAFSALTIFFASCGGGGQSGVVPSAVQPQAVTQQASEQSATTAVVADWRSYGSIHYVARLLPPNFVPSAIMRSGRIPGSFGKAAAIFHHGHIDTLGSFQGQQTKAVYVNNLDQAVGMSEDPQTDGSHALLFSHGTIRDLGHLPNGSGPNNAFVVNAATVISDTGDIYGYSDIIASLGFPKTVKFTNPGVVRLPPNNGDAIGFISDINRYSTFAYQHSFGDAPFPPLPATGRNLSYRFLFGLRGGGATSINDRGDVAGYIDPVDEPFDGPITPADPNWKAFLKRGSSTTILPYLPGATTMIATGLNNRDDLVGPINCEWAFQTCPARVFVYTNGKLFDAAKLLPSIFSSPVSLMPGLSDRGRFVVMQGNKYYLVGPDRDQDDDHD